MLQNQIHDLQTMIYLWIYSGWGAVLYIMLSASLPQLKSWDRFELLFLGVNTPVLLPSSFIFMDSIKTLDYVRDYLI